MFVRSVALMSTGTELYPFVESETEYFFRCSDCERISDTFFNPTQACNLIAEAGWTVMGKRLVCQRCVVKTVEFR